MNREQVILEEMLKSGYSIDYGQLSICEMNTGGRPYYQVYCENYRYPEAKTFKRNEEGLVIAVSTFLNIKKDLEKDGLKNSRRRNTGM